MLQRREETSEAKRKITPVAIIVSQLMLFTPMPGARRDRHATQTELLENNQENTLSAHHTNRP